MPAARFEARHMVALGEIEVGSNVTPGVRAQNEIRIKRVAAGGVAFSRTAELLPAAEFRTQVVQMDALKEIFGLSVEGYYLGPQKVRLNKPISKSVSVQISVNGGATYLHYNNGWIAEAVGGAYTSVEEFCERCGLFVDLQTLLNPKSLSFRIKLSTYTDEKGVVYTPVLTALNCHVEWDSNPYLDLFRTIKELVEEDFRVPVLRQHSVTAANVAANSIPIDTNYTVDASKAITAFNITQDVNKNVNIANDFDAANNVLNLAAGANVAASDVVEFTFQGSAPVFVVRPDEMAITSTIPSTIITIQAASEVPMRSGGKLTDFKIGSTTKLLRIRNFPVYRQCAVRVEVYARSAREAISSIQSLERTLTKGFQSIATGETLSLKLTVPSVLVDFGDQSYYSGNAEFMVEYFDHSEAYQEVAAVRTIVPSYGDFKETFATATITETGVVNEIL